MNSTWETEAKTQDIARNMRADNVGMARNNADPKPPAIHIGVCFARLIELHKRLYELNNRADQVATIVDGPEEERPMAFEEAGNGQKQDNLPGSLLANIVEVERQVSQLERTINRTASRIL